MATQENFGPNPKEEMPSIPNEMESAEDFYDPALFYIPY